MSSDNIAASCIAALCVTLQVPALPVALAEDVAYFYNYFKRLFLPFFALEILSENGE